MSASEVPELLVCDTSFVGLVAQRQRHPERVAHWDPDVLTRIDRARNAISVFTLAEARAGYLIAPFSRERIAREERRLQAFGLLPLDDEVLAEWVRLRAATTDRTLPHNAVDCRHRSGARSGAGQLRPSSPASARTAPGGHIPSSASGRALMGCLSIARHDRPPRIMVGRNVAGPALASEPASGRLHDDRIA